MVRFILAVIGVIIIWIGIEVGDESLMSFGILPILPAVITILIKAGKKVSEESQRNQREQERIAQEREEYLAREREKQEGLQHQEGLIAQFKSSQVTQEVLKVICYNNPSGITPEQITIYYNRIEGTYRGNTRTFDFAANRVFNFETVSKRVSARKELDYVVRPQVAMAEALNSLLGDKYAIYDNAKETYNHHTDSDGDSYFSISYVSDHVTMVLKSTLPSRSF